VKKISILRIKQSFEHGDSMEYKFSVETHSPTDTLVQRLIQRYGGGTANITVAYLRIKDNAGTVLGQASVSSSDWSDHEITKSVTISTAGTVYAFTLESSDGAELFRYNVPSPFSVSLGDTISITWRIGISLGTNCKAVYHVLENIEGTASVTNLKANGIALYYGGTLKKTFDPSNSTIVTDINDIEGWFQMQVTFTSDITFDFDEIRIINPDGVDLIAVSGSGSVSSGVETTITIKVTVLKG